MAGSPPRQQPDLHLPQLRSEFALISSSLAYNAEAGTGSKPDSDRVFFCDFEFGKSQHSFSLVGARIYAENAIHKRNEQMSYLRLASRLDAVVTRLDTEAKMQTIGKSMAGIVKALDSSLATRNLRKMSGTMEAYFAPE